MTRNFNFLQHFKLQCITSIDQEDQDVTQIETELTISVVPPVKLL